jgi:DNA-binding response OmpR family regulator
VARLLVVEDDPLIAAFVVKALTKAGHAPDWVTHGNEALVRLSAGGVDLVLLDLGLPDVDGLDVLERCRWRGDDVPVVVITSRSDPHDRDRALKLGVDAYLTKPFAVADLLRTVTASSSRAAQG